MLTSTTVAAAILVVWSLFVTLPAVRVFARDGTPAFSAIAELHERLAAEPGATIGLHQALRRSVQTQLTGQRGFTGFTKAQNAFRGI